MGKITDNKDGTLTEEIDGRGWNESETDAYVLGVRHGMGDSLLDVVVQNNGNDSSGECWNWTVFLTYKAPQPMLFRVLGLAQENRKEIVYEGTGIRLEDLGIHIAGAVRTALGNNLYLVWVVELQVGDGEKRSVGDVRRNG